MVNIGFRIMTVLSWGGRTMARGSPHHMEVSCSYPAFWVVDLWEVFFFFEVLKLAS